jgi:hypothetical protein
MRLNEWKKDAVAVANAQKLMKGETFIEILEIMRDESPLIRTPTPFGASAIDHTYAHGMQAGFVYALAMLNEFKKAQPIIPPLPEADFSPNNVTQPTE